VLAGSEAPGSRKTTREEKGGWEGISKAYLVGSGLIHWVIMGRPDTMTANKDMSVVDDRARGALWRVIKVGWLPP